MSKLTKFLKLFQYEPEADKQKTFNITEALNNNWDKVDAELEKWDADGVRYNLGVHQGKNVTIPNTKAGDYILPNIKGNTVITKPNPNAEISPDNIAALQGVVNPVFTASDGKGNSTTAALQSELYSLPNGVCDEYDGVSGKLTKRTYKLVFNGTEDWKTGVSGGQTLFALKLSRIGWVNDQGNNHTNGLCSHYEWSAFFSSNPQKSTYISNFGKDLYFFPINITTIDAWKAYLVSQSTAGTPITVIYELVEPIITYPSIKLTAYDGTTTVSCNDTVLQEMSVTVADSRKVYSAVHADMLGGKSPNEYLTLGERITLRDIDLNNLKTVGSYAVKLSNDILSITNSPFTEAYSLDVSWTLGNDGYITQKAIELYSQKIKSRIFNSWNSNGTWSNWAEYAMGETLTADKAIYVRKTGNDETGDGSNERPYLTVGKAIDYANKVSGNFALSIVIGDGTYEETPIYLLSSNLREVRVLSESANSNNVYIKINGNGQFSVVNCAAVFHNLTFSSNLPDYNCSVRFDYCKGYVGGCKFIQTGGSNTTSYAIASESSSQIFLNSCIVENTTNAFFVGRSSLINCVNISGYCNGTSYVADGGIIMYGSSTLTSATVKAEVNGGLVRP